MDQMQNTRPVGQLKTNKSLLKYIFLSLITFGIYGLVVMSAVSNDVNIVMTASIAVEECPEAIKAYA